MPSERIAGRRQNPVACQMCRAKKLRCNLRQPCSNCSSREWKCEYTGRQDALACESCRSRKIKCDRRQPCANCSLRKCSCVYSSWEDQGPHRSNRGEETPNLGESSVQNRLANLEQAVFGRHQIRESTNSLVKEDHSSRLRATLKTTRRPNASSEEWLEEICGGLMDSGPPLLGDLHLSFKTTSQLASDFELLRGITTISLPPRDFTSRILDLYAESLESAQQIMHIPSVRIKVRQIYEQPPGQDASSQSGIVALILALSALIGFWETYKQHGVFHNADIPVKVSTVLARQANDALDYARGSNVINIETVQAAVLLVFLFHHMEGFSERVRALHSTALTMARELHLHRIDSVSIDSSGLTKEAIVELETRRKLWWYIASTDWLLAFHSGPSEGVYSVIPQQMSVKKPRNLKQEDLMTEDARFEQPNNQATNMAYYFFRIRLAEICREAVDGMLLQAPETVPYQRVYDLDSKFTALTAGLPGYLQMDAPPGSVRLEYGSAVQFDLQRGLVNLMASVRRCKMYLPFLLRCKANGQYNFSRNACLESARALLKVRRAFSDDKSGHLSSFLQVLGIDRFAFYGTMVLVMDLCVNNPRDREQLFESSSALRIVAEAQDTARTTSRFLNALRDVLSKHGISLPAECQNGSLVAEQAMQDGVPIRSTETEDRSSHATQEHYSQHFGFAEFESLWPETISDENFLDPHCWDELIDLDMIVI